MTIKSRFRMRALAVTGALAGVLMAGCNFDEILRVQPASLLPAVGLEKPENAALLVSGAASDFDCAFNSYVAVSALIGEEFEDALQTADRWWYDQRTITPNLSRYSSSSCTALGVYTPLQVARVAANNIRRLMENWTDVQVPNRQLLIARAAAYEGWSTLLLGESFCECVLSTVDGEVINYGGKLTRAQVLQEAVTRLTQAVDVANGVGGVVADSIRHFALVARARAYQNLNMTAEAKIDAAAVPVAFAWNVTASGTSARRNNRIFQESNTTSAASTVGTRYRTLNDPRVPVLNLNRTNPLNVPLWAQRKYTAVTSSIPVAQGHEMQLLIAEIDAANAATRPNAVTIINTYRARGNQGNLPGNLTDDPVALRLEIIDQRRRELWLTGTHLGDIIRYDLQVSPAPGTQTPWGAAYGPDRGSQLCLPLPDVEKQNNPVLIGGS